jgi:hypothetical protein
MKIIRIPKGDTLARLTSSKGHGGRIQAAFTVEGRMSAATEQRDYATAEQAENDAVANAERRQAICLIIDDRI